MTAATADHPSCHDCEALLVHCHGTLIVHDDGGEECTDAGCETGSDAHHLVVECAAIGWSCGCR